MHLLDTIAQTERPLIVERRDGTETWLLPSAADLRRGVEQCPLRFVLHDDATMACTQLAFEDETILGSSIELLRVPATSLWLEFSSSARRGVFAALERLSRDVGADTHQRIGMLVLSEENGRRGTLEVCWESGPGRGPDLAPFVIAFDFDDERYAQAATLCGESCSLGVDIEDHPGLGPLFRYVRFVLRPQWQRYYRRTAAGAAQFQAALRAAVDCLLEDVPFFAMFCLLLSSRGALEHRAADRSRLNQARRRRGRALLLDHVEITMNLTGSQHIAGNGNGNGDRTPPRLHFVRGHLVRRGSVLYWRKSHMRGHAEIGSIRSRTVLLRAAG